MIPRGYGLAWWEPSSLVGHCYPIPLNLILRGLRNAWLWTMQGRSGMTRLELEAETQRLRDLNEVFYAKLEAATQLVLRQQTYLARKGNPVPAELLVEIAKLRDEVSGLLTRLSDIEEKLNALQQEAYRPRESLTEKMEQK